MGTLQQLQPHQRAIRPPGGLAIRQDFAGAEALHAVARPECAARRSPDRAPASQRRDLRRLRVRSGRDAGALADRPGARCGARRVPGLRAYHDRDCAPLGHAGALCLWLSLSSPQGQGALVARRDARLDGSLSPEPRLGRVRSDQQHRRRGAAHPCGDRARLRRRAARPWHVQGRRRQRARRRGARRADHGAGAGTRNSCACRSR